ncbi:GAF and ANTAR domain-containing protein [Actinokineospora diospyrosa]|uniref:ANTAR domain-containing protein n=1 Tax=Actinokineospora diospyrosa TaxID=103728 RepID=A0ABT1IHL4_9PSEU|nr:GAF and ANTAR domain-containing protein [Actinokineospora diospyrosa]MCP2272143.1 ANTAR domain-containing protein [Actinokineospora diospyrosa]
MTDAGRPGNWAELTGWIAAATAAHGGPLTPDLLCALVQRRLAADGVVLVVMINNGTVTTHSAGVTGSRLAEAELTVGQGPLTSAWSTSRPVLVPDLTAEVVATEWPLLALGPGLVGVAAVFAFPMVIGAVRLGALGVYRRFPGELAPAARADAVLFTRIAMDLLISETAVLTSPRIHQATGMVAVQLGTDVSTAFASLRARAFADGRALGDLADDVVARTVRFTELEMDPGQPETGGESS